MSDATVRRDHALETLRELAARLENCASEGTLKANESADRSDLAGYIREVFVREYVASHVRGELRLVADLIRFVVTRLEPRRAGNK